MNKNSQLQSVFVTLTVMLICFILLPACEMQTGKQTGTTTEELSGNAYISRLVKENNNNSITLDLSDEKTYVWVMEQLTEGGWNEKNSPQLFKEIKKLKDYHYDMRSAGTPVSRSQTRAESDSFQTIDHRIWNAKASLNSKAASPVNFQVDTLSTVTGGSEMILNRVKVYDEKGNEIAAKQEADYSGSPTVMSSATGELQQKSPIEISSFSFIKPAGATKGIMKADFSDVVVFPAAYNVMEPKEATGDGVIRVCLLRGYTDCDYDLRGYNVVKLPFKGTVTYGFDVLELPDPADLFIKISLSPITGGVANLQIEREQVVNFFKTDSVERTISWDIPQTHGQFDGRLYDAFKKLHFQLSINGPAITMDGFSDMKCFLATNVPDDPDVAGVNYYKMPPFEFAWSCLAEGTGILMGDGSVKNIEEVRIGDMVMSGYINYEGEVITEAFEVGDISTGGENEEMIYIEESRGNSLLMTRTHPVVLPDNTLKYAGELELDDLIMTETGAARIINLDHVPYSDTVYNLKLNITDNMQHLMPESCKGATMFAGGIMVGDLVMQRENEFLLQSQTLTRKEVPAEWKVDYYYNKLKERLPEVFDELN